MSNLTTDLWTVRAEDFPGNASLEEQAEFLLRYAVLAPSSHNTQPWAFRIKEERIDVYADLSRWLEVADSDQRELHLSVGCALENLVVAAEHFGFAPRVEHVPNKSNPALLAHVHLEGPEKSERPTRPPELFDAIVRRHTNRREYDKQPISGEALVELRDLAIERGIGIHFTDEPAVRRRVDELTLRADAVQFADPEWREELGYWFGQGAFGTNWLISKMAQFAVSHLNLTRSTAKKDHELLESASVLGLVAVDEVGRESRVRAGQVFERLFLAATDADLALQPMNQILQVAEVREEFEALVPAEWGTPQITFRLGSAEGTDPSPRRPLKEVLHRPAEVE